MIFSPSLGFNSLEFAVFQTIGNADGGWLNDSNLTAGGASSVQSAMVLDDWFSNLVPFYSLYCYAT